MKFRFFPTASHRPGRSVSFLLRSLIFLLSLPFLLSACHPASTPEETPPAGATYPLPESSASPGPCFSLGAESLLAPVRYNGENSRNAFFRAICEFGTAAASFSCAAVDTADRDSSPYTYAFLNSRLTDAVTALLLQPYLPPVSSAGSTESDSGLLYTLPGQLSSLGGTLYAGAPGVGILYRNRRTSDNDSYLYAYALLEDGILPQFVPTAALTGDDGLPDDLTVLLLPLEQIGTLTTQENAGLAAWVREGGVLLCLGSPAQTRTENTLKHLFSACGATLTLGQPDIGPSRHPRWLSDRTGETSDPLLLSDSDIRNTRELSLPSAQTFLTLAESPIGICQSVGSGYLLAIGLPHAAWESSAAGSRLIRNAVRRAAEYHAPNTYCPSTVIRADRGNYRIIRTLGKSWNLTGLYLDLTDPALPLRKDPTVAPDSVSIFYALSDASEDGEIPEGLVYASGPCRQTDGQYQVTEPRAHLIIRAPEGLSPASVLVQDSTARTIPFSARWDRDSRLLSLSLYNESAATVLPRWQEEDTFRDIVPSRVSFTVPTNQDNLDREYLYFCNAGVNSRLRFADKNTQIIYRFSMERYPYATLTLHVLQNYLMEISPDAESWTLLADYSQGGTVPHTRLGNNDADIVVTPAMYGDWEELYIRIRNTDITQGWGGSISSFTIEYLRTEK